ncbi:MAG: ornithine cyclodeaminase [Pseudomonadota bacterium]
MTPPFISFAEGEALMTWDGLGQAFLHGHTRPKASIEDSFLYRGDDTVLSRAAWIDGMGQLVKTATIFPGNAAQGLSSINGAVTLFSDETGVLEAVIDFHLVTKWKTAGDSVFAATQLARPDSRNILIVGAGTVAHSLREAYGAAFPDGQFTVWNRTPAGAEALAAAYPNVTVATDLETAVRNADIVTCATMSAQPVLRGEWLQPGQHIDLIGAYRPDMREADDACLQRARVFVDSRDTTLGHIGEIKIPLEEKTISEADILADYYQPDRFKRLKNDEITLFKNGGGAHLDLMTSRYILEAWRAR